MLETELKLCKWKKVVKSFQLCHAVVLNEGFFCVRMSGDPHNDPNAQGDAFKTLFVARVVSTN